MDDDDDDFPQGLRALVVDDDFNSLSTLESLFQASHYQVTTCKGAKEAICILRGGTYTFDIVLTEVYMQEFDGFHLLQVIQQEMDYLPVVMMSSDGRKEVILKGVEMGACDILLKPIRMEEISVLWQHIVRKRRKNVNNNVVDMRNSVMSVSKPDHHEGDGGQDVGGEFINGEKSAAAVENCGSSTQEKKEEDELLLDEHLNEESGDKNSNIVMMNNLKKPRMIWTPELHQQFVAVVNSIGLANAVPKKILEHMQVAGLTRENVASHLQKYRIHLQRKKEKKSNSRDVQQQYQHPHHHHLPSQVDYVSPIHHHRQFPTPQTTSIVIDGGGGGGGDRGRDQHSFGVGVSSSIYHHRHHHGYDYRTFSESSSTYQAIRYQETCQAMQKVEGEQSYNHHHNYNNSNYNPENIHYAIPLGAINGATTAMIEVTEEDDATKYDQPQQTLVQQQPQQQQTVEYHQQQGGARNPDCINFNPYDDHIYYPDT